MKTDRFLPGINTLLSLHPRWLASRRIGLLSHPAALDAQGRHTVDCLLTSGANLTALFGPEHGFFGAAGAGESVSASKHPALKLPVYSLYGAHRRPTPSMLRKVDTLVVDLQDLGVRCYTYLSTLRYVMEEASKAGKEVIVADRPVPLPDVVDGPVTAHEGESFVAPAGFPMVYGMTPGEAARWIRDNTGLQVDLKVAPMRNYLRESARRADWPPWAPPSPGIVSWESALCYPATVFSEAFGQIDHGAGTGFSFQVLGAHWMRGSSVCEQLRRLRLPGVAFYPHAFAPSGGRGGLFQGVRLVVRDTGAYRPAATAVAILATLHQIYGVSRIWKSRRTRPGFLDKLFGTTQVRQDLLAGADPSEVCRKWRDELRGFKSSRDNALLYRRSKQK